MEIKKSFDLRRFVILSYILLASIYLAVGFSPKPAEAYNGMPQLSIPAINLNSDVTTMKLNNGKLNTPDDIVGSFSYAENKVFLVGHRVGVFENLNQVKIGDEIIYENVTYVVREAEILAKAEISMNELLKAEDEPTLVVMTCAGEVSPSGDASHRLIITASAQ